MSSRRRVQVDCGFRGGAGWFYIEVRKELMKTMLGGGEQTNLMSAHVFYVVHEI